MLRKHLSKIGPIEDLILIEKDSRGQVTCFVIFREKNILDRIAGHTLTLEDGISTLQIFQALSYKQLSFKQKRKKMNIQVGFSHPEDKIERIIEMLAPKEYHSGQYRFNIPQNKPPSQLKRKSVIVGQFGQVPLNKVNPNWIEYYSYDYNQEIKFYRYRKKYQNMKRQQYIPPQLRNVDLISDISFSTGPQQGLMPLQNPNVQRNSLLQQKDCFRDNPPIAYNSWSNESAPFVPVCNEQNWNSDMKYFNEKNLNFGSIESKNPGRTVQNEEKMSHLSLNMSYKNTFSSQSTGKYLSNDTLPNLTPKQHPRKLVNQTSMTFKLSPFQNTHRMLSFTT